MMRYWGVVFCFCLWGWGVQGQPEVALKQLLETPGEGKGKVVDVFTPEYDVVARFAGGPNAGHTIIFEGKKFVLRSIPSGIFAKDKVNIIGNGCVIAPDLFMAEAKELEAAGYDLKGRLHISKSDAASILPATRTIPVADAYCSRHP